MNHLRRLSSLIRDLLDSPGLDRLGIGRLFHDHNATMYRLVENKRVPRRADRILQWGGPVALGITTVVLGWRIESATPIIDGVAIIAGGLFGFLVLVLGVQTLGVGRAQIPAVRDLVRETRANAAYATAWALVLAVALMVLEAFRTDSAGAYSSWGSALILAGLVHLGLVLLMVLNRIRLIFANLE